jgi:hypothetical protein
MKRHTAENYATANDPLWRRLAGQIRKVAVDTTSRMKWKVLGYLLSESERESFETEVFPGIGFYARPSSSGKPESIVLFVGGAGNPAMVASRDEKTRKAMAGELAADETAMFNSQAIITIRADGTILIKGGKVFLGDDTVVEVTDGVLRGTTKDTNTGLEFWQLGGASRRVFSK